MPLHRTAVTLAASALVLAPALASSAADSQVSVGSTFAPTANCGGAFTDIQTGSPDGSHVFPTAGVVTAWQFVPPTATPPTKVALKVARSVGGAIQVVASTPQSAVSATRTTEVKTRIPVQAGDLIGMSFDTGQCARGAAATYTYAFAAGDTAVGAAVPNTSGSAQFDISATLESDADGDGFGDVSQDKCSTDKTTQGTCPAPVTDRTAPETSITSATAAKAKSARKKAAVTTTFSANETSTFECAVDGPVFVPCTSPFVTKLKVGKHTIAVRATDAAGNVDKSAAVVGVKVKVGKPKK